MHGAGVVLLLLTLLSVALLGATLRYRALWRAAQNKLDGMRDREDTLMNAVDTIAVEVERVSESQRFLTKALAERPEPRRSGNQ